MNKGYTEKILSKVHAAKVGDVITSRDFPDIPTSVASALLNRIARQSEELVWVKRGVYSKAAKTRFGLAKATPLEVLNKEISGDKNKCFGGLFLFNQLGLTSQVPRVIEILNNKSSYVTNIGDTPVRYVKIRPKITSEVKKYIIELEVIKKIKEIPDVEVKKVYQWLENKLKSSTNKELNELVKISLDYPPRVRAVLGCIINEIDKALSKKLKDSLNDNSYFRIGELKQYLKNTEEWKIKA